MEELPADLGPLEAALLRWNHVYETVRPHQALGYKTPEQFCQNWLKEHREKKPAPPLRQFPHSSEVKA